MCPDCKAQHMAWLLYRENYSAFVADQHLRYQLIREQTAAIRHHCHDNHQEA